MLIASSVMKRALIVALALCLDVVVLGEEICHLPLDVMFLQDTTGSFHDDLPNVLAQLPGIVDELIRFSPTSWFGVAEFRDKPFYPLGMADDFCFKIKHGSLSPHLDQLTSAYLDLQASGGGDLPEAQFEALIAIAQSEEVGWRPLAQPGAEAAPSEAGARIVIVSTDARIHLPDDIAQFDPILFPDIPRNLPEHPGTFSGNATADCISYNYPRPEQVASVLKANNIHLVILTPQGDPAVTNTWKWVNSVMLGQPDNFYNYIEADSSNILDGVVQAVSNVVSYLCPLKPTLPPTLPSELPTTRTAVGPPVSVTPTAATITAVSPPVSITPTAATITAVGPTESVTPTASITAVGPSTTTKAPCRPCHQPCPPCASHPCRPCHTPCKECNHGVEIKFAKDATEAHIQIGDRR